MPSHGRSHSPLRLCRPTQGRQARAGSLRALCPRTQHFSQFLPQVLSLLTSRLWGLSGLPASSQVSRLLTCFSWDLPRPPALSQVSRLLAFAIWVLTGLPALSQVFHLLTFTIWDLPRLPAPSQVSHLLALGANKSCVMRLRWGREWA